MGTFDGVHLGHREVLAGCDTALTFDPHPMRVLAPSRVPKLLSDRGLKLQRLDALGIRRVAVVPFDLAWAEVPAEDFVEQVLIGALGAELVSVGRGFRFGADGAGTTATFAEFSRLRTRVVPLVSHDRTGDLISSTRIRALVHAGEVELAGKLLGAPFAVSGLVGHGGRLVIPTELAMPPAGSYRGYLDSEPCSIHVSEGLMIAVTEKERTGAYVQISFLTRIA